MKCRNITEDMRSRVDRMVKVGAFDNKSGGGNRTKSAATKFKKKGAANAVVEEEDNGEENGGQRQQSAHPRAYSLDAWHVQHSGWQCR